MSQIDPLILPPLRGLPEGAKYVVLAGEAYILYKGGKFLYNQLNPSSQENLEKKTLVSNKTDAQEILKNNLHLPPDQQTLPSFSKSQYETFASTLFNAMDGTGTDEEAILGVFKKMDNDLDILYLTDAFGTREGSSWFASSSAAGLADWLRDDAMTTPVNNLLATKAKITRRF